MTKRLCQDNTVKKLEVFLAFRGIRLDRQPRVGVIGEALRHAIWKIVMKLLKRDVLKATGSLQLCTGQDARSEAAIRAVYKTFNKEAVLMASTEAVLMANESNTFNAINWKSFLHNTKILCPSISTYINNCFSSPTDHYAQGGRSIKSEDGTRWLSKKSNEGNSASTSKQVAFTNNLNGIGTVESVKNWWSFLQEKGNKFGYNVNAKKSYLIVKRAV